MLLAVTPYKSKAAGCRRGYVMKLLTDLTASLVRKINALVAKTEANYPGMSEVAAMVYVGDVYALREQRQRRHADGWGKFRYSCDSNHCRRLP